MEIGRQPPVPNPSSFYFSGVWGPRNPSLKKWEILPINYPPLPLGRPEENGKTVREGALAVKEDLGSKNNSVDTSSARVWVCGTKTN